MLATIGILATSLAVIWLGAGLVVKNVESLARNIHVSRFIISLFLLGAATSISEFSVAVNSLIYARPQISIGNLMGGSTFLILVVIPMISIFGGNTSLKKMLPQKALTVFAIIILVPLVAALDGTISVTEGAVLMLIYLVYVQSRSKGVVKNFIDSRGSSASIRHMWFLVVKIIVGTAIVFVASNTLVQQVIELSETLGVSTFLLSIIVIAIGTNTPEMSIAARSLIAGKKDIAIGNYIGSAAVNTPIMGFVAIVTGGEGVTLSNVATPILLIFIIGVLLFYKVCRSGESLSRKEAMALIGLYLSFLVIEGAREYFLS